VTLLSTIDLQTIRDIVVDCAEAWSDTAVTDRRQWSALVSRYRSQVREVINRNALVTLALEHGFNAFLPVYDGGVDFILYREEDGLVRKVQLKGRWYIDRKYEGRDIWIAFPVEDDWYVAPHDELIVMGEQAGFTSTASWVEGGAYSCPKPSRAMLAELARFRFGNIDVTPTEAAA
jgi:hypothetical protein